MNLPLNRSVLIFALALVIGGLAAFGVNRYIQSEVDQLHAHEKSGMVKIVVPKDDMPKGSTLTAQAVAVREIPAEWSHSNAVLPQQFDRVEGQKLAYPLARGEMLLWSLLEGERARSFSSRLAPGRRAITVQVDETNSISGMLEPGDRIDLMASVKKDGHGVMFPLLQNVSVLATGTRATPGPAPEGKAGMTRTFNTITLEVSPAEAERVLAAREVGKLEALLRAPGDTALALDTRRDSMALLGLEAASAAARGDGGVPVIYGGRRPSNTGAPMPGLHPESSDDAEGVPVIPPRARANVSGAAESALLPANASAADAASRLTH